MWNFKVISRPPFELITQGHGLQKLEILPYHVAGIIHIHACDKFSIHELEIQWGRLLLSNCICPKWKIDFF